MMKSLLSIGLLLTGTCAFFLFLPRGASRYYMQAHSWTDVEGTVIGGRSCPYNNCDDCRFQIDVEYRLIRKISSQIYIAQSCWKTYEYEKGNIYNRGDTCMMKYNPSDPSSAVSSDQVTAGQGMAIGFGIGMGAGIFLVLVGIGLLWRAEF